MNKFLSFAFLIFIFACDPVEWDEPEVASVFCLTERETVAVVKDMNGTVIKSGDVYLIESISTENNLVFAPCNLPDEYKMNNLSIIFSGKQKEVFENEKWAGQPVELIKIKKGSGL
ncbi:MAG: hypothetical protein ACOCXH_07370 [Cyclobacteriaceae bacterium]